ncbi:MAG: oxidoreductase [Pelagibacteraceae bacterium]|nr:oxidoreductase [Pelagibacteraceae bacterium]|tara:strand:+ start:4890 stop:5678 length:789 start_codon:yes stop_codon:yes gene_type:complete
MDLGIKGKTALVTGGCNGIGESISELLAKEGVNLLVTSRKKESIDLLKEKLSKLPISVEGILLDFFDEDWFLNFKEQLSNKEIDILVNNAGHNLNITNPYCEIEDWRKIMNLNFEVHVQITNHVVDYMKNQDWGRIVNITSCAGLENSGPVTYTVSKAALTAYTRTMGRILATECNNVVMSAIFPGVTLTKGGHWDKVLKDNPAHAEKYLRERSPLGRFAEVDEISPVVLFYCSELASFSHGAIVPVDAGQSRHFMYHNYLT